MQKLEKIKLNIFYKFRCLILQKNPIMKLFKYTVAGGMIITLLEYIKKWIKLKF